MADFENATPFAACTMPSADRDGIDLLLIVVAASFLLPLPGHEREGLRPTEVQDLPPLSDEYVGEPGRSSIRREGQLVYTRPATDISIVGHACAPHGRPVTAMNVHIRVGSCAVALRVHGDRVWHRGVTGGARPSSPQPFLTMPLIWERAYGGVAASSTERRPLFDARNPVGCGLEARTDDAIDKPVPNIEHPNHLIVDLSDRPEPMGVTPVARHWQPRVGYAGTYDETWRRERAPLWPADFDERFFCGAPGRLQARPHLRGGEPVVLRGLHSGGPISFQLPTIRFVTRSRFIDRVERTTPVLDGVVIDTDALKLTMYFRSFVPAPLSLLRHRETLLRLREPWETSTL